MKDESALDSEMEESGGEETLVIHEASEEWEMEGGVEGTQVIHDACEERDAMKSARKESIKRRSSRVPQHTLMTQQLSQLRTMDRPEMRQASDVEDVEHILSDASAGPVRIPYAVIKSITKNFAEVIGTGAFGLVYLGMLKYGGLQNGMVAVKKVTTRNDFSDKLFVDEFNCLKRVKHKNIVRFLGYCADTQGKVMEVDGKKVIVEEKHRFLCFEYVPNGDLHHYLEEKLYGFQWNMRYQIIKGVCEGLDYLQKAHIYHLDLKPENVLLGAGMEPKITDFGLARFNDEKKSTILVTHVYGTMGYIAPEMIDNKQISRKSDIYSLGIIMIRLLTGNNNAIVENWHESLDGGCKLMDRCIEIAQNCVDHDPSKRPTANDIIHMLNLTEAMTKVPSFFNELRTDPPFSLCQIVKRFQKMFSQTLCDHCRMVDISDDLNMLERILEGSEKPSKISYPLLQFITRNFSDERRIGHNELGEFFKGILRIVAVTRLSRSLNISDKIFHQEVKVMTKAQHGNIIRFLGNCSYAAEENVRKDGEIPIAERERLLCFEYLSNGSLKKHLSDELRGLQWHTRYQIIRGICEGLRYLHKERAIVHKDFKPACILLDDCMVPKITEFGISELKMTSSKLHQQRGYSAPESMFDGIVSLKANIHSLGMIILELVTGSKEAPCHTKVLRRWKHRWNKSGKYTPLGCQQIIKCLELAQSCLHKDPNRRPVIWDIVRELNELDNNPNVSSFDQINSCLEDMLGIEPLELHFPFEHNKAITHSVGLINDTDDCFAFRITTSSSLPYCTQPSKNIVRPRSRCSVTITLEALEMAPEQCKYGASHFYVQSTRVPESLIAEDITEDMFDEEPADKVVDKVDLIVVLE